jgi:hypothetical protein
MTVPTFSGVRSTKFDGSGSRGGVGAGLSVIWALLRAALEGSNFSQVDSKFTIGEY